MSVPIDNELGDLQSFEGVPPGGDEQPGEHDEPDFKQLLEQAQQESASKDAEIARLASMQQRGTVAQIEQLWAVAEQQMWANAQQMEPEQAKAYASNFFSQRDLYTRAQAEQVIRKIGVTQWREELRKRYKLSDQDMQELGSNPDEMEIHARRIRRNKDDLEQIRAENRAGHAAAQGRQRIQEGANVPLSGGGPRTGDGEIRELKPGSREKLLYLIEQGVMS